MAFKTDSIKLKNYADASARNSAITSPSAGDLALTAGSLQVYTSAWANVDTAPSHSYNAKLASFDGSDQTIPSSTGYTFVTYYVTADQDTNNDGSPDTNHALKIKPVAEYGAHARVEIINGSNDQLVISKNNGSDQDFDWNGTNATTVDIGIGQRAIFLRIGNGARWEVIVLSL